MDTLQVGSEGTKSKKCPSSGVARNSALNAGVHCLIATAYIYYPVFGADAGPVLISFNIDKPLE